MVASLVFLDARLTLRALLGVGENPVGRLALVLTLLPPQGKLRARRRIMSLLPASEAKHGPTLAPYASRVA